MSEVVYTVSPFLTAPFGPPEGWDMSSVCVKNKSNDCGVLVRNKTTGVYKILVGRCLYSIEQDFADSVWHSAKS